MRLLRGYSTVPAIPRWFRAVDVPQTKPGIFDYSPNKEPQQFEAFSTADSARIEHAFLQGNGTVMVEEDGLMTVNLKDYLCKPTFWDGPGFSVRRSLWFEVLGGNKVIPLGSSAEQQIEEAYQKNRDEAFIMKWPAKDGLREFEGKFSTKWNDSQQPMLTLNEKASWLPALSKRYFYRGAPQIKEETPSILKVRPDYQPREMKHLVFCVHGIGQLLSVKFEQVNFVNDVNGLRRALQSSYSKIGPGYKESDSGVQVLPVLWRHRLSDTINGLRPQQLFGTTNLAADAVLDFVMYTEITQRKTIQTVAADEMNRMYREFCDTYPEFRENPKVSIIGHSLGSVIAYDLVNPSTSFANLDFEVTNLFTMGSPIGVIDLIRQVPTVSKGIAKSMFNIMRLEDPIASRLEPLVTTESLKVAPKPLPGGHTNFIQQVKELTGDLATQGEILSSKASTLFQFLSTNENVEVTKKPTSTEDTLVKPDMKELKQFNRHGRLDFSLQESIDISLILGLAGHLMYLDNPDVAQFVLKEILEI